MADPKEIKEAIDDLVSELADCDRSGCRCWEAKENLRIIAEYAKQQAGTERKDGWL